MELNEEFAKDTTEYTLNVSNSVSIVRVNLTKQYNPSDNVEVKVKVNGTEVDSDSSIPVRAGGVTTIDIKVIATISQSQGVVTEVSKTYTIRVTRPARVEDDRGSRNQSPFFVEGRQTARSVAENTPAGQNTGEAIAATDPTDDPLTYALLGRDAALFDIDPAPGRLLTKASLDYEAKSSYQATVRVRDDGNASDSIDVTITITNVEEAGTVSVSPGEPEVGTALTASLSDPDGSLSDISWQWARSSDRSDWSNISGADSDTYTPVADDVGVYLRATASYTDGHGSGKSADAVSRRQTAQRGPAFGGDVTSLTVDENTPPGALVGDAITATDPDDDILTYPLSGTGAASFVIDGSTGQIAVGSETAIDYESGPARHTVIVSVHDGRDAYGNGDTTIDDHVEVNIGVNNVEEAGTVSVSPGEPEVETALIASLSDPDGSLSDISWQWARSSNGANWQETASASSSTYTPVGLDADKYLRATASYADGKGFGKQAQTALSNVVQGPTPKPTPIAVPSATRAAAPIVPVDDGGVSLWWIVLLAAGAVAAAAGIYVIVIVRNHGLR